ncbi:DNA-binding protein [Streptomyces noursei]|uniref:hypothetical protein n=1 Tax=Streptomyces noursei TaxID=1971 RepID=UPI00081CB7E2|nr:hypothetical protein SNOUR_00575 [Streptomyces noursei ATCC 11455]ANZ21897.1 hypothetical protein SNOUR_43375 [Streptomyces noursei ATCC 11455]MCZ0996496.1 DNA-binding protein [Streptomyces noursei]
MTVTTRQVGQALGFSIPTVNKLLATGLVPGVRKGWFEGGGYGQVIPDDALQALQRLPDADLSGVPAGEVAVLRADAATPVEEDNRRWVGFGVTLTEEELLAALQGWWRCNPQRVADAKILVVTVATYTVAVLTGLEDSVSQGAARSARHWFPHARLSGYLTDLTAPVNAVKSTPDHADEQRLASLLLGKRLFSESGGPIAYVKTRPATSVADIEGELS